MNNQPVRIGIIGMGGFAGDHHRAVHALEKLGECRLTCACDPYPDAFSKAMEGWDFAARNIPVFTDYREMLEAHHHELDMVTIPTPIPYHAPMHRAAVELGLACYLEKPPTLDYAELNEMLVVEAGANKQTQVGFNFIIEAERHAMKQRILEGEFGEVRRVGFLGMAPRATSYFTRSNWAGRLMMDGRLVLDSVMGNALAHYLHNLLCWAGCGRPRSAAGEAEVLSWESVTSAQAEMYRAHAIENMDTLFARGVCVNGIEVVIAATHACEGEQILQEWIECEQATIRHTTWQPYQIEWKDGRQETIPTRPHDLLQANFQYYFDYLRGGNPRPLSRLSDTRPFVEFYNLAYVAARQITPVVGQHVARSHAPDGKGEYVAIRGIRAACDTFLATGRFPSEQALEWSQAPSARGGKAGIEELERLRNVVEEMVSLCQASDNKRSPTSSRGAIRSRHRRQVKA
jgi:predicted dehydrogenase